MLVQIKKNLMRREAQPQHSPNRQHPNTHAINTHAINRSQPQHHRDNVDFMGTLPFAECDKLQIGDHVDHRDDVGRFLLATIVDKDTFRVKIHYEGWNSKWDTWCDYKAETHRFAAPRSVSRSLVISFGFNPLEISLL